MSAEQETHTGGRIRSAEYRKPSAASWVMRWNIYDANRNDFF